jgi:hypothetical protein
MYTVILIQIKGSHVPTKNKIATQQSKHKLHSRYVLLY